MCNKSEAIRDLIIEEAIDVLCLNETWLNENDTSVISSLVPDTHNFYHNPRALGRGGGVAILVDKNFPNIKSKNLSFTSFECMHVCFKAGIEEVNIFSLYRPPGPPNSFFEEFEEFLLNSQISSKNIFYVGDLNFWVDDETNADSNKLLNLLQIFNLKNYINCPTFNSGHTLDLVIGSISSDLLSNIDIEPTNTISDHRLIKFNICISLSKKLFKTIKFNNIKENISEKFRDELSNLSRELDNILPCQHSNSSCAHCLTLKFRSVAKGIYEEFAPVVEKVIPVTDATKLWYNAEVKLAKKRLRKAEKEHKKHKCQYTRQEYKRLRKIKENTIKKSKENFFRNKIENCHSDPKMLYRELNYLLGKNKQNTELPECSSEMQLANDFKDSFIAKVERISESFPKSSAPLSILSDYPVKAFERFQPVSSEIVLQYIRNMNKTYCPKICAKLILQWLEMICLTCSQKS